VRSVVRPTAAKERFVPTSTPHEALTTAPLDVEARVARLHHLIAAHEAVQTLKHELTDLAAEAPAVWDVALSDAERISVKVRSIIHDADLVITGEVHH
jgi:hypothetical protein